MPPRVRSGCRDPYAPLAGSDGSPTRLPSDAGLAKHSHVMPGPEAEAMGAFHTADVPYFINHYSEARADYWGEVDYALGDAMSDYLVNFASTGDVNGPTVTTWNAYAGEGDHSYMELGDEVSEQSMADDVAAFWAAYLEI